MDTTARPWLKTGAIGLAGLAAGGILATTVSATAEDSSSSGDTTTQDGPDGRRAGEEALTGDTADKVREAALAKYPGATVDRVETDSDGVYEAHLLTSDGTPVTVEVGEDFAVTGTEEGFGHHDGGFGHHDAGFGDDDSTSQQSLART